jgi:hypothetical protein
VGTGATLAGEGIAWLAAITDAPMPRSSVWTQAA